MTADSTKSKLLPLIPADQFGTAPEREARAAALAASLKVCNAAPGPHQPEPPARPGKDNDPNHRRKS